MNSTDREEMTEADVRRWMLQNGVTSISLVDDVDAHVAALSRPSPSAEDVEMAFLAGHADGWRGNQLRRDVQHVDAAKGWEQYSKNRAALSRPSPSGEDVEQIAQFVEDWNGWSGDGDTFLIAEAIRERFAALSLPHKNGEVDRG